MKRTKHKLGKSLNNYVKYSNMSVQMAIIIGGGTYLGIKLDQKWNLTFPWMTLTLSLFSIFVAIYLMIKDFIKPKKKNDLSADSK